jgi:hypothetical protein
MTTTELGLIMEGYREVQEADAAAARTAAGLAAAEDVRIPGPRV